VNAIDVTAKTFFERLHLVPGPSPFEPRVTFTCAPTLPPFTLQLFLDFCAIFPRMAPQFFCLHDSPKNLAVLGAHVKRVFVRVKGHETTLDSLINSSLGLLNS